MGHVRAVLLQHLAGHGGPSPSIEDPNELVPAHQLADALGEVALHGGEAALHEAGASYARLWARTFRTLVRHMRGHPEHALQIWSNEVWPFLRGDRLAAKATKTGRRRFEVLVHDDLPAAYVAGMLQGFVALSHADVTVTSRGGGRFDVQARLRPSDRANRIAYQAAQLRIPLLLTSLLAAMVGTALGWSVVGPLAIIDVLAIAWGTVAAQSGANAFHDLYGVRRRPLDAPGAPRNWLWFQFVGSYAVAATALVWLVLGGRPGLLVYGAIGLLLGLLYRRLRDRGYGPAIAAISHGPLTVWGCAHAFAGVWIYAHPTMAILAALPTGLVAAAILFLDDLADRPIDEAAGKRTLVMRLPRRRHVAAFAALSLGGAIAASALFVAIDQLVWLGAILILTAGILVRLVRVHLDDPHGLAPARIGVLALYLACAASVVAAIVGAA